MTRGTNGCLRSCLQSEFRMEGSWEVGGRSSWEGKTPRGVWIGFRRHRIPGYYR